MAVNRNSVAHACYYVHNPPQKSKHSNAALCLMADYLHHPHVDIPHPINFQPFDGSSTVEQKATTPATSPKEIIAEKCRQIHGFSDGEDLLALHPWLPREIVKYGELAQATSDAFHFDSHSKFSGTCRYNEHELFDKLSLAKNGYQVTKYLYAMSKFSVPKRLERSHLVDAWSKYSSWMGYVAVSDDDETRRIGRRDIVVAWRGTKTTTEWFEDIKIKLDPIGSEDAKVVHGFWNIYTSKSKFTRHNKSSASEQVMEVIKRLVQFYREKGEEVSLTITGHSLGGALALLNAYEAASTIENLPIRVISFGAPRVGNNAFKEELEEKGVKTLRVVIKQDVVPKLPGMVFNKFLEKFDDLTGISLSLGGVYTHVGAILELDIRCSPYLKHWLKPKGFHSLKTYLYLVDWRFRQGSEFPMGGVEGRGVGEQGVRHAGG